MIKMERKVAAVLVTYNRVELLKLAVDSLLKQSFELKHIVIVDNNSNDGTSEYLKGISNDKIRIVTLSENTGGAGGFHAGMDYAHKLDIDYIWIMDDDAIASKSALNELIIALDKLVINHEHPGFLCSHVLSDDNECMNVPEVSKKRNSTGYFSWPHFAASGIIGVDKATFVSVLINKKVVTELGLPIKEMFIWGDDTEYTWRISSKYSCYYVASSIVYHKRVLAKSLSLATEVNVKRIPWYGYLYRNNLYNVRKHGKLKDYIVYANYVLKDLFKTVFSSNGMKFKKVSVLISGVLKGVLFNPRIKHP